MDNNEVYALFEDIRNGLKGINDRLENAPKVSNNLSGGQTSAMDLAPIKDLFDSSAKEHQQQTKAMLTKFGEAEVHASNKILHLLRDLKEMFVRIFEERTDEPQEHIHRHCFDIRSSKVFSLLVGMGVVCGLSLWGNIKRSVLGTLSVALWFYTLGKLPFGTNMTLIYTTPLFMAANFWILAIIRHERAPWALILSIVAGFAGITIVLQPSFHSEDLIPALICLSVALVDLAVYWQMKELGRLGEPSWRIVFYFTVFGSVFGFAGAWLFEGGMHLPTGTTLLGILGMGLCATRRSVCRRWSSTTTSPATAPMAWRAG